MSSDRDIRRRFRFTRDCDCDGYCDVCAVKLDLKVTFDERVKELPEHERNQPYTVTTLDLQSQDNDITPARRQARNSKRRRPSSIVFAAWECWRRLLRSRCRRGAVATPPRSGRDAAACLELRVEVGERACARVAFFERPSATPTPHVRHVRSSGASRDASTPARSTRRRSRAHAGTAPYFVFLAPKRDSSADRCPCHSSALDEDQRALAISLLCRRRIARVEPFWFTPR